MILAAFSVLKIYSIRNVHCRFSVLTVNIETQSVCTYDDIIFSNVYDDVSDDTPNAAVQHRVTADAAFRYSFPSLFDLIIS